MPAPPSKSRSLLGPISFVLLLLTMDAIISLALLSSMVAFLHGYGEGPFVVRSSASQTFLLAGHPAKLITNHGHTVNGAGGTAVVLVGFGGLITLLLERRARNKYGKSSKLFYPWAVFVVLSCLLSLSALIYTFVETSNTDGQIIDIAVAAANAFPTKYPLDRWTPENWYLSVLDLPLVDVRDVNGIEYQLRIMRGWRWNTIALFLCGFVLAVLVIAELVRSRRARRGGGGYMAPGGEGPKIGF